MRKHTEKTLNIRSMIFRGSKIDSSRDFYYASTYTFPRKFLTPPTQLPHTPIFPPSFQIDSKGTVIDPHMQSTNNLQTLLFPMNMTHLNFTLIS